MRVEIYKRAVVATVLLVCSVIFVSPSWAVSSRDQRIINYAELQQQRVQEPSTLSMAADVLVGRPFLLGATAAGTVLFVVSLPLSILGGNVHQAADKLVLVPAKATFLRCLGCVG